MNYKDIVYERFIKPLRDKKTGTIGVELEFPLLNLAKSPVNKQIALGMLSELLNNGFRIEDYDLEGNPAFIVNENNDCISFDNSYNNIEFSMNFGNNLLDISSRFYKLLEMAQNYFSKHNYLITGFGTNPYKQYTSVKHVNYPVYNMVEIYLHKYNCETTHDFPDFPAYLSSVQTHLDIDIEDLPKTATLFCKIDFLRGLLFSNSPDFDFSGTLCYRDYLWHKSAFGLTHKNTGPVDENYKSIQDIQESFYERCMFNNIREGEYRVFSPIKICNYFKDNPPEDINNFLSFRHVEFTYRGTLEIRSDCSQPLSEALLPPAFNLGIASNIDEGISCTDAFLKEYKYTNSTMRNYVVSGRALDLFDKDKLIKYAVDMVEIAYNGLKSRKNGEEILLNSVFKRAESLICPALYTLRHKSTIDTIILKYSDIKKGFLE